LLSRGYLEFRGRKFTLKELLPDGLHVVDVASEYLAEDILAHLKVHLK
jgi:hypothetical protein